MRPPPVQIGLAEKYGTQYGVDPRLLLAIGGHETQWGTLGAGRQGYTLGYGATDSGTISKYAGVQNQYRWAAETLAKWGVHSLQDLLAGKAASYASDPHWEQGVAGVYRGLGSLPPGAPPAAPGAPPVAPGAPPQLGLPLPPPPAMPVAAGLLSQLNKGIPAGGIPVPTGAPIRLNVVQKLDRGGTLAPPKTTKQPVTGAGMAIVTSASQQLGQPYVWGGESRGEGGFDCSGLVDWALRQHGYTGPRLTTWNIAHLGVSVKGQQLRPGDLVLANGGEHVVIYAGGGKVIAAPHHGTVVQYQPLSQFNVYDVRRV